MDLGWCDVCLRVASAKASRDFYAKLGFRRVEGDDDEGWAVVTNDDVRLGLFEAQFMGHGALSLNFRGGDVEANCDQLEQLGVAMEQGPTRGKSGGWSARFRDPDGYLLFLDTAPGEVKKA